METGSKLTHPFEAAGLGLAPFRFVGYKEMTFQAHPGAPVRAGGSCDYCCAAIRDAFLVASSDGKTFKVGCDCVTKLTKSSNVRGDATLQAIHKAANALRKARKDAKDMAVINAAELAIRTDSVSAKLQALPHPLDWQAAKGGTRLDWALWMLSNAGTKGKLAVAKFINAL